MIIVLLLGLYFKRKKKLGLDSTKMDSEYIFAESRPSYIYEILNYG